MAEDFDDFARRREKELQNRKRLAEETATEWGILKGFVSQFALDRKGIDGCTFESASDLTGNSLLVLNYVSAALLDGNDRYGVPRRVHFSRRPGQVFPDDSPVAAKTWSLEPEIRDDEFLWFVRELGRRLSSAKLSEKIAEELARYHIEYEKAYGRAS